MTQPDRSGLETPQVADTESAPSGGPPDPMASTSLDEAIQSSLDTIDQELASLEAALQGEFGDAPAAPNENAGSKEAAAPQVRQAPAAQEHVTSEAAERNADGRTETVEPMQSESPVPAAEPAGRTAPAASPKSAGVSPPSPVTPTEHRNRPRGGRLLIPVLALPLRATAWALLICDRPFSRMGKGTKNLIGSAGIATCAVAAMTWLAGERLKDWAALSMHQTTQHTDAPTDPPNSEGQPAL